MSTNSAAMGNSGKVSGAVDHFDYVIVGSGAAGAILANRLSEDGKTTVCLLEAGPSDWHPFLHIPAGFIKTLFNPAFTWQFQTEAGPMTNGRRIPVPQGRTLGGSTSVNGLVYNRGQHADFDGWAALGNDGWSFADVLPYFKRMEKRIGGEDQYRGRNGELPVTDIDWIHPLCEAFIKGATGLGMPRNPDYNGADQAGVGYFQRTIDNGWRMSTARTFLTPVKSRLNLTIRTNARATRVLLEQKRAVGVEYVLGNNAGNLRRVMARREVILSCGAINTPRLLQLSGIGNAGHLKAAGIEVQHHLPGVGEHLSDHYSIRLVARVKNCVTINELARGPRLALQIARWMLKKPSIMALSPSLVHYFWKSRPDLDAPDLQGVFAPASYREGYVGMLDKYPGITAGVWQHRPESLGYVRVQSNDPFADPVIEPNYLQHENDRRVLIDGARLARKLLQTPELAPYVEQETLPGVAIDSDDELLDFARRYGVSSYHLNGTARMGPATDAMAVVDSQLRVVGLQGLRIADSSVMPKMPSANVCATTMMIGDKASDLIRGK
ncbi:GMC family oxidoreductase [Herbaspirillum autotrophicum]|uniref:GMC family oxidoreductase n=1 Tax=Herbaspirillum autotrophicum TaxID=180195 RepID=UPI000AA8157F|nr:GMC family oxidoreductase N-terminal domain-containing protein [Herbaspirillum autotrophicum]